MTRRPLARLVLALAAVAWLSQAAAAQSPEAFWRGRTVTMLIGAAPGAAYDLVGRAVAAHIGRFLPGEPAIVVQNMPGAASLVMANQLYNRAPRDGSVIGLAIASVLVEPKLRLYAGSGSNVQFDPGKFGLIGSPSEQPLVLWVWHTSTARTFADLKSRSVKIGATSPSADGYVLPVMLNRLLGTRLQVVSGYHGIADIFLAVERNEVEADATPYSSLATGKPQALANGEVRILAQFGIGRIPALPGVPTGLEIAGADEEPRRVLAFYALKFKAAFPLLAPPALPPERLSALQAAFDATMKDEQFLAVARRGGIDVSPVSGKEMEKVIAAIDAADEATLAAVRRAAAP